MRNLSYRVLAVSLVLVVSVSGVATYAAGPRAILIKDVRRTHSDATVTPVPRKDKWWVARQDVLNSRVKSNSDAQLLFIGDSITHGWDGAEAQKIWQKYYGKRHAVNLGIGGDQTQHVLWRLDHGNLEGIHPKLAVLMIGTNNSGSNTPEDIAAGVHAIVEKLRTAVPECKVLILAIFPRGADSSNSLRQVNEAANERIAKFADGQKVFYLDIGPKFLGPDGTLSKTVMPDLLHPNTEGYEIWARSIEPTIAKLLGESS